jgi:hypothetical protein
MTTFLNMEMAIVSPDRLPRSFGEVSCCIYPYAIWRSVKENDERCSVNAAVSGVLPEKIAEISDNHVLQRSEVL